MMTTKVLMALGALTLMGLGTACTEGTTERAGGEVVAMIGDTEVTRAELEKELSQLPPYVAGRVSTPEGMREFLDNLLTRRSLMLEAERMGLHEEPQITRQIQEYRERLILQRLMAESLPERTELTEDELRRYYDQNRDQYSVGEQVRVSQILIGTGARDVDEARGKARSILDRARAGEDFTALARSYSEHSSAQKGGDLGFFPRGRVIQEVEDVAFSMREPGQLSDLIETDRGLYILRFEERKEAQSRSFEDVREQIRRRLAPQKEREAYEHFVAGIRDRHEIRINEDALQSIRVVGEDNGYGQGEQVPSPTSQGE